MTHTQAQLLLILVITYSTMIWATIIMLGLAIIRAIHDVRAIHSAGG